MIIYNSKDSKEVHVEYSIKLRKVQDIFKYTNLILKNLK